MKKNRFEQERCRSKGLQAHAELRTARVRESIKRTKKTIELELDRNGGIYPLNSGRLSQAEFCRRAGISPITLLGASHKTTSKLEVDRWLEQIHKRSISGKNSVRKAVTERAARWEEKYKAIANEFHLFKLELISKDEEIRKLREANRQLAAENMHLKRCLSSGNVIDIGSGRGR